MSVTDVTPDQFQSSGAAATSLAVLSNLTGVPMSDIRVTLAPAAAAAAAAAPPPPPPPQTGNGSSSSSRKKELRRLLQVSMRALL
jgi:hypothetical protein